MSIYEGSVVAPPQTGSGVATSGAAERRIAEDIRAHHALMVAELDRLTRAFRDGPPAERAETRRKLDDWIETVLIPHADEEEETTYRAAGALIEGRLLIDAMVREHALIKRLVALFGESEGETAAAYGRAVYQAFTSHQNKENELILPFLIAAAQVSLAEVVGAGHGHQVEEHMHVHP